MFTESFIADITAFMHITIARTWLGITALIFALIAIHEAYIAACNCTLSVASILWLILCVIAAVGAFCGLCAASRAHSKARDRWMQHKRKRDQKS